jgi:hypothetical protein
MIKMEIIKIMNQDIAKILFKCWDMNLKLIILLDLTIYNKYLKGFHNKMIENVNKYVLV